MQLHCSVVMEAKVTTAMMAVALVVNEVVAKAAISPSAFPMAFPKVV